MIISITYLYHAMTFFFAAMFIWILFSLDNSARQVSCAIVLIPLILRVLLIR